MLSELTNDTFLWHISWKLQSRGHLRYFRTKKFAFWGSKSLNWRQKGLFYRLICQDWLFEDYFGFYNTPMAKFHELCHENCTLTYFGWFLELRKLDFMGLKGQIDVKNANLRGLIARIGHYRPILATRIHLWHIFMEYDMGIVP